MELKLTKSTVCTLDAGGKPGRAAAAWMGLSFFLRMVYYFGFMNLNDIPGGEIAFGVVLPLVISAAFILMLKIKKLSHPIAAAGLALAFAVNCFLNQSMNFAGIVSGILTLAAAVLMLTAVLGYLPEQKWLLWVGIAAMVFRILFVDVFGYILPLLQFRPVAYLPTAANLFGVIAVGRLCAAFELKKAE